MPTWKLTDLRAKALSRLDGNSTLYTTPEIDYVINEAIRCVFLFTGYFRDTVNVPGNSVANKIVYSTPPGILYASTVYFNGRQLEKLRLKNLVRKRRNWATDNTNSRGRVEYWAPIGNRLFVISPNDALGGQTISVVGMAEPPKLVHPTDIVMLENEYVDIITDYCTHRMPFKIGGKIFSDGSLAMNEFYKSMKERKSYEMFKQPRYFLLDARKAGDAAAA